MNTSIIIPTYNAEKHLSKLLSSLETQTFKDFELIIIDSSSSDNTLDIAKKHTSNIITIPTAEFDHGGTRTKAAKIAKGDIIIFFTQDALPYNEYTLENIIKAFEKKNTSVAYGRQIPYENTNIFGKHLRLFNYFEKSLTISKKDIPKYKFKTSFVSNSFAAYRKETLESVGWFEDNLIFGEDAVATTKIILKGFNKEYCSEAIVYHSHSYSVLEDFKRYFDIGIFHKKQSWLLKELGKPEGEGIKYIKSELKYILDNKKIFLIFEFLVRNMFKFIAYKLGKNYKKIPYFMVIRFTLNKNWIIKNK